VNRPGGREKGERRRDDLVASPDVERPQGEQQGVSSTRAANREAGPRELRYLGFETLYLLPQNEVLRVHDLHYRADDFVANGRVLRAEVKERDGHRQAFGNKGRDVRRGSGRTARRCRAQP
jgi:hypothetical protein